MKTIRPPEQEGFDAGVVVSGVMPITGDVTYWLSRLLGYVAFAGAVIVGAVVTLPL